MDNKADAIMSFHCIKLGNYSQHTKDFYWDR